MCRHLSKGTSEPWRAFVIIPIAALHAISEHGSCETSIARVRVVAWCSEPRGELIEKTDLGRGRMRTTPCRFKRSLYAIIYESFSSVTHVLAVAADRGVLTAELARAYRCPAGGGCGVLTAEGADRGAVPWPG